MRNKENTIFNNGYKKEHTKWRKFWYHDDDDDDGGVSPSSQC
jgi:hypothetical protein